MENNVGCFLKSILLILSFSVLASSKIQGGLSIKVVAGNPAHEIVSILNHNRTTQKLSKLNESPGLGCIALQYVKLCEGNCNINNTLSCEPPEDDFTQVFAPNCGVELPTLGTITGHILGCSSKYATPQTSFSDILFRDSKALALLRNRSHSQVGVGMVRLHKSTFFWCLLFSDAGANFSFALDDNGRGIKQRTGCYSGSAFSCSYAHIICVRLLYSSLAILLSSLCLFNEHLKCWF